MKKRLLMFCLLSLLLYGCYKNNITSECNNNKKILDIELEGQEVLDELVKELKGELMLLEKENPGLTLEDKINFTNKKVRSYIAWINESTAKGNKCYTQFLTKDGDELWGDSFSCLRRNYGPHANFTASQRCGACGEYANLNKYLLENTLDLDKGKVRVVGAVKSKYSLYHGWNEILIDGEWVNTDATSYPNFLFNDTFCYENNTDIKLNWVIVTEGKEIGKDLTKKYNPKYSSIKKGFYQLKLMFL